MVRLLPLALLPLGQALQKANLMRQWLTSEGSYINPKVEVEIVNGLGYGLRAIDVIHAGEEICQIPRHLYFAGFGEDPLHDLAVSLCEESQKGKHSFFTTYLDTLPSDISYLPTYWDSKMLHSIRGTLLCEDIDRMKKQWTDSFNSIHTSHPDLSPELYQWARATIQGRAWSLSSASSFSEDRGRMTALIPFVSLCNHSDMKFSTLSLGNGITCPSTSVSIRADSKYYPSEAINLNYGDLSFQQRILCFGWVDRDISRYSFAISPITIRYVDKVLQLEAKSMIREHSAHTEEVDVKVEKSGLKSLVSVLSEQFKLTPQDSSQLLLSTTGEKLSKLKADIDMDTYDMGFNGLYYFHNAESKETDSAFIRRVELNSLLSLQYAMQSLLASFS